VPDERAGLGVRSEPVYVKQNTMGERLIIGKMDKTIEEEHVARYEYASQFIKGKSVIDAACGSGYGTLLIADGGANEVIGVDISEEAIAIARTKYAHPKVKFRTLDVESLSELGSEIADTVVSFETIEHVADDRKFLKGVNHVLRKGGTFIVSSPERRCGGVKERVTRIPANPFHRREYTRSEFARLLSEHFVVDEILGQNQIPRILTFLPVTICVKMALRVMAMLGKPRLRDIYLHGTGKELLPEQMCRNGMPRFWVIRCHKGGA